MIHSRDHFFEEHAQDGRGAERAAQRSSEFLGCLAARIRVLCAPWVFKTCATLMGVAIDPIAEQNISRRNRNSTPCLSAADVSDLEEIALQVIEI